MIRAYVIASTPMLQAGLRTMLTTADIQVVGASSIPDAFNADLPGIDVIVVADTSLLEKVGRALAQDRTLALVVLAHNLAESPVLRPDQGPLQLLRSLALRGWGIVPIDAPAEQLQAAIQAAAQGLIVLPGFHPSWLYERTPVVATGTLPVTDEALTGREREVLELVSQGLSNKLIARQIGVSESTVRFHLRNIFQKLKARSRLEAVTIARQQNLLSA